MKPELREKGGHRKRTEATPAAAQAAPAPDPHFFIAARKPALALAALTYVLTLPLFAPWSVWPLGFIVFVPWLIGVCGSRRGGWAVLVSYLLGTAFFLTHWRWLYNTTPPGYIAGSLWFALYFPLSGWSVRHLWRRRRVNLAIGFPVVWVLTEMLRSHGPLAFPWFLLGHSQIRLLPACQLADITGVCGVSFILAAVNGWCADILLSRLAARAGATGLKPRLRSGSTAIICFAMLAGSLAYGRARTGEQAFTEGPRISVLQGDFILKPVDDPGAPSDGAKRATYMDLLSQATAARPDMIVLPETPWSLYLNRELRHLNTNNDLIEQSRRQHDEFLRLARQQKTHIVVGSMSLDPQPRGAYPQTHRYNSAFVYAPDGAEPGRYDKIHLVLFGEYVPFRFTSGLHWLYSLLNRMTPWGGDGFEYSLTAGEQFTVFRMQPTDGSREARRFGVTICYEDVIPQVFRRFVSGPDGAKRVDFMLNISNDGWFGYGSQQPQHLVNCAFRAIENRVGIARAVNTGVSGFIAPDGRMYELVAREGERPLAGGTGYRTSNVLMDARQTFYSAHGDLFGLLCSIIAMIGVLDAALWRWTGRSRAKEHTST